MVDLRYAVVEILENQLSDLLNSSLKLLLLVDGVPFTRMICVKSNLDKYPSNIRTCYAYAYGSRQMDISIFPSMGSNNSGVWV